MGNRRTILSTPPESSEWGGGEDYIKTVIKTFDIKLLVGSTKTTSTGRSV